MTTLALENALFAYLSTDPQLSSLVEDRIFPIRMPEGTVLPAVTYARVSSTRTYFYEKFEDTDPFTRVRVQFNCWSNIADQAMEVGEAVLLALSGYDGDMAGQLIGSSFNVLEQDQYEGDAKLFRRILDFHIMYEDDLEPTS